MSNKISTLGYFKKRLKDNGFIVLDLFKNYSSKDQRKWTLMLNPGTESLIVTCRIEPDFESPVYEFIDSESKSPIKISTSSMEVIVDKLLTVFKLSNNNKNSPYFKPKQLEKNNSLIK
jgi:hypothetical protein